MFDWNDYLELGKSLAQIQAEAAQRSAISRAYYAAFCTARNWLLARGFQITATRQVHDVIWNEFIVQTQPQVWSTIARSNLIHARRLGNDGFRLRKVRQRVDYEDHVADLTRILQREIDRAERIREGLQLLSRG
jgi:uncharacterized protein (UPF0332 family)